MSQIKAAHQLLKVCEAVYRGVLTPEQDIQTKDNVVETYADPIMQKKYVHMYFAKYVGCWRAIRKRLPISDQHKLVSIGAGPLLCCVGWHWDGTNFIEGATVKAYDLLGWHAVRRLPEFTSLWDQVFTGPPQYIYPRYMPDGIRPPQAAMIRDAEPICVSKIGSGKIVLLPSILNHLVGESRPVSSREQRHVFDWIESVREAGNTVVIADMLHRDNTARFWRRVTTGLGAPAGGNDLNLDFAAEARNTAQAYSFGQQGRRRAGLSATATKAGVLWGSRRRRWSWLTNESRP